MEYKDFIRLFDRMCSYYQKKRECPMGCPMNGCNISQCRKIAFEDPETTEKTVSDWANDHKECCVNCALRYKLVKSDYSACGCKHTDMEGYLCMAYAGEGIAEWMVGNNPETGMCERYTPKEG